MKRIHVAIGVALLSCTTMLGIGGVRAQQNQGAAEKAGEKIDDAGRSLKKTLQDVGEKVREQFAKVRESVHDMSVETRVYGRLHWDKDLVDSTLDLDVKDGVATLRGAVPTTKAKLKAV